MKRILHQKLSMYKAVSKVCNINTEVWNQFNLFTQAMNSFNWELEELVQSDFRQKTIRQIETQQKRLVCLMDKMLTMCKVHSQIFPEKMDEEIERFCLSTFATANIEQQISSSYKLYHVLRTYKKKHNFSAICDQVTEFKQMVSNLEELNNSKEQMNNGVIHIKEDVPKGYDRLDQLLSKNIDKLMIYFKRREPSFYAMYFQARSIEKYIRSERVRA